MPRNLDNLPWRELGVDFSGRFGPSTPQLLSLFLLVLVGLGHRIELAQSSFDIEDGLFEFKSFWCGGHYFL